MLFYTCPLFAGVSIEAFHCSATVCSVLTLLAVAVHYA
jgi:hypothetical protein